MRKRVVGSRGGRDIVIVLILGAIVALALTVTSASAALQCTQDTAGANDEPGQKDLTQFCIDDDPEPGTLEITWNWDETSVIPSIADFDAVYAITLGIPYCDAIELMFMMLPLVFFSSIHFTTSLDKAKTAFTLVEIIF